MARILIIGLISVLAGMWGQAGAAQSASPFSGFSAPDIEISAFGGIPAATRYAFPSFGMQPDLKTGGFAGVSLALRLARQPIPGWSAYLALAAGHMRQRYVGHSAMSGGGAQPSTGQATQSFVVGIAELRRPLGPRVVLGLQGGMGLMDHDVTGTFDANAKTLAAMAGVYASVRLAPYVSAGPYAMVLAPLGTGSVQQGRSNGIFTPGAAVMMGVRVTIGL